MMGMLKMAGVFAPKGQKPTDPMETTTSVHGNQMVQKSPHETTIIDLDKQTITTIHNAKKTYSVVTFAEMKQQLQAMQQQMASNKDVQDVNASVDVHVTDTGKSQNIAGVNAHEEIMTMSISGSDPTTGKTGAMTITMDMWVSPDVPGSDEMLAFYKRMAEELNWMPGMGSMGGRPELAKAMADIYKEGSKLKGLPVENIMRMGVPGQASLTPEQQAQVNDAMAKAAQAQQEQQQRQNQQTQDQNQQAPTSARDAVASAIGQHFGFGRHKKQQQTQDDGNGGASNTNTASSASNAAPVDASNAGSCNCLMEMTSHVTSFQSSGVDPSWFTVPDGYKQVQEDVAAQPGRKH